MIPQIPPPELVLRLVKGAELTWQEGDDNLTNVTNFATALQTLVLGIISESLNEDGTLTPNSVGMAALQNASVAYSALNPSTLYSLIPIGQDDGTVTNQYHIAAVGGYGFSNIVPPGAAYDNNGNYTLTALTPNMAFLWTPFAGGNDTGITCGTQSLSVQGSFTAFGTTAILTGKPNDPVTATVIQSAAISAYEQNQIFFVATKRSNTGPVTLSVNGLPGVPVLYYGAQLQAAQILGSGIFAVVYQNGAFWIFGGAQSPAAAQGGGTTVVTTTGYNGVNQYTTAGQTLFTSSFPQTFTLPHGLGAPPNQFAAFLQCATANGGYLVGQQIPLSQCYKNDPTSSDAGPAFSWAFDGVNFYITQYAVPYVVNPGTGSYAQITSADFTLIAVGSVFADYAGTTVFPALNYEATNIHGAFCFGNQMYVVQINTSNGSKYTINQVNMVNNEITPVTTNSLNITTLGNINGQILPAGIGNLSLPYPIFACISTGGTGYLPLQNPNSSIIGAGSAYNASGNFSVGTLSTSTAIAFTWTPSANDGTLTVTNGVTTNVYAAHDASGRVVGPISFSTTNSGTWTATMTGVASTVIVGTLYQSTNVQWNPVSYNASFNNSTYKIQWIDTNGYYYGVPSDPSAATINSLPCIQIQAGTSLSNAVWTTQAGFGGNTANLNLTSSNIGNNAQFQAWSGSAGGNVFLFQYNPITQRIYVITESSGLGVVHIFQLGTYQNGVLTPLASNNFAAWWATQAGGGTNQREGQLNYVKSIMLAGMGRNLGTFGQSHITIDYDMTTGKERAIVFTRQGGDNYIGSITRVPWAE
jgi:hypothetical protein